MILSNFSRVVRPGASVPLPWLFASSRSEQMSIVLGYEPLGELAGAVGFPVDQARGVRVNNHDDEMLHGVVTASTWLRRYP